MSELGRWVESVARAAGGPGLFFVAFLDSSFLSLPEINDLLVIWMVTQRKELVLYYAAMATLGSIAGCLTLYYVGRRGGDAVVRRRFSASQLDRAFRTFNRYGVVAIIVPALLPPPAPFKIFVLLAGVAKLSATKFAVAIALGRGTRYLVAGLLAVRYGDAAIAFIREHGAAVALGVAVAVVVATVAFVVWRRVRRAERL